MSNLIRPIGILGGTFDPIHFGHLRMAVELYQNLNLQEVRFIPCQKPVHKKNSYATAEQRLNMVQLAIADEPGLVIDTRELVRPEPSYMTLTLQSLRAEVGSTPLVLIVGIDSLAALDTWYHWQEIFELTHIVAINRAGFTLSLHGELGQQITQRLVQDVAKLHESPAGHILLQTTTLLDISATQIRRLIASQKSARYLLPDSVLAYIKAEGVYLHNGNQNPP